MSLKDIDIRVENNVVAKLEGVEYKITFPTKALKKLQVEFGGWIKAMTKMTFREDGSDVLGEYHYPTLAKVLEIGIGKDELKADKIESILDEMMEDEITPIVISLIGAKSRYLPQVKDKVAGALEHLRNAKTFLEGNDLESVSDSLGDLIEELEARVEKNEVDPQAKTA